MNYLPFESVKRKILIKDPSVKLYKLKPYSNEELLDYGVIPLNKPAEIISLEVVETVKKILSISKAGHGGTLDPKVTGVLPIGVNRATKLLYYLLLGGKKYKGTMYFHSDVSKEATMCAFEKFSGIIKQIPPVKSSVKRVQRERTVYYLKLLKIDKRNVDFEVGCESGTYVRKLCHDIGEFMGTKANMKSLVRIQHANIFLKSCLSLSDLKKLFKEKNFKKIFLTPEKALSHLPKIWVDKVTEERIKCGSPVYVPGVIQLESEIKKGDFSIILSEKNRLIAIGEAQLSSEEILSFKKGVAMMLSTVVDAK